MRKKAVIFDLDNTIYAAHSIGGELYPALFDLINQYAGQINDMNQVRAEIMRRPFVLIAKDHHFSKELTEQGIALLQELTYPGKIEPFDDYNATRKLTVDKFLVTTGFPKLQQSKIEGLEIRNDFKEIHIVDPTNSDKTKKDVFADIMERHNYPGSAILVVGDDLLSEIKAAQELGIDAVLYDKLNHYPDYNLIPRISDFNELGRFLG